MKKHIAKTNTDQRCVVMFMQIPGREDHALICPTDALPPRLEQAVMEVTESAEGQATPVLAQVMGRRLLGDTGETVMAALFPKFLHAVPIDTVTMMPYPNRPYPLRDIINAMGGNIPTSTQTPVADDAADVKFNPYGDGAKVAEEEIAGGTAQSLLSEAELLEAEARIKRERAYRLAPGLRPKSNGIQPLLDTGIATKELDDGVLDNIDNDSTKVVRKKPAAPKKTAKKAAE